MFNVGGAEIVVVLLVALIVLGPEQLPKAMRTFGNVMSEVRKVSNGFQDEMRSVMNTFEDDGDKREKPHSLKPPSGAPSETAPEPAAPSDAGDASHAEVNEVVARNPATDPAASVSSDNGAAGSTPSGADRAAG